MIRLYNSYSLKIEDFISISPNEVLMYVCGPTVYDHAHVGNARPIVVFDVLKRVLIDHGYSVKYVSNYTDIDDKIINKAIELGVDECVISNKYIDAYQDLRNLLSASGLYKMPKVTDNIKDIILFIERLIKDDYAYIVNGDVYFDITKISDYGSLSKQNILSLEVGNRVDINPNKRNSIDFTLWKQCDHGLAFDSPFSKGRPGWHSECVVMINKELGDKIDIHGGGSDLRFPHHENEIAQAKALFNHGLANYWVHNGMVNIEGIKMSKSLGNIKRAIDIIGIIGVDLFRYFMMSVHYRKELNFSDIAIDSAKIELDKLVNSINRVNIELQLNSIINDNHIDDIYREFIEFMYDDLNTPNAYNIMHVTSKNINLLLRNNLKDYDKLIGYYNALNKMLDIIGIKIKPFIISDQDKILYQQWLQAKNNKDYGLADSLRNKLIDKGIL